METAPVGSIYTSWDGGQPLETAGSPPSVANHRTGVAAAFRENPPNDAPLNEIGTSWTAADGPHGFYSVHNGGQTMTQWFRQWQQTYDASMASHPPV